MDHGTIPASTAEIKKDLDIGDGSLGVFGSLVYLGNILGKNLYLIRGFNFHGSNEKHKPKICHYIQLNNDLIFALYVCSCY